MTKSKINWWKKKWGSLKEIYQVSLTNSVSFEELYSAKVTKARFYSVILLSFCFVFILAFCVISFTPIKRIVPGFESDEMHQELVEMKSKLNQMEIELAGKVAYSQKLDTILSDLQDNKLSETIENLVQIDPEISSTTKEIKAIALFNYHFYAPVNGAISQEFNLKDKHFGIDIVCNKNETVKSALSGKVILAVWSVEEGNIIAIQHQDNLISFYKHNSVLLKRKGDLVKSGEVIAVVGNSGEHSTGPHLHFEIWQNGTPINPIDLISFN